MHDLLRALRRTALLIAALAASFPSFGLEATDDRGVVVSVAAARPRIVALSPHLTEIAYSAGAGDNLVAVVRYSDYPEAARRLPRVGDAARFDTERILALAPDLVLAWQSGNPAHEIRRIERLGIPVFVTEARRLTDVPRLIRVVGMLAGRAPSAEDAARAIEGAFTELHARYASRRAVRVFYQIWQRPLLTVNGAHLISDVIAMCGGRNVFANAPVLTPAVSVEAVLAARPDIVLGGSSASSAADLAAQWRAMPIASLRELPARYIPPDLIQRQTPRIVHGARLVCEHLEAFRSLTR